MAPWTAGLFHFLLHYNKLLTTGIFPSFVLWLISCCVTLLREETQGHNSSIPNLWEHVVAVILLTVPSSEAQISLIRITLIRIGNRSGQPLLSPDDLRAICCGQKKKSFQLVWRCHQLLSGYLTKGPLPRFTHLSANDKGDNEVIQGSLRRSHGIYFTAHETPRKHQPGESDKSCETSDRSNVIPYL